MAITTKNQRITYPKGAQIEAIRDIPMSAPAQNYFADPLPRGARGTVSGHTDDGRAWIFFDGDGSGHTFDEPERYEYSTCLIPMRAKEP